MLPPVRMYAMTTAPPPGRCAATFAPFQPCADGGPAAMDEDGPPRPRSASEDDGPVPGDGRISQSSLRNNDGQGTHVPGTSATPSAPFDSDDNERSTAGKDGGFLRPHAPCDN